MVWRQSVAEKCDICVTRIDILVGVALKVASFPETIQEQVSDTDSKFRTVLLKGGRGRRQILASQVSTRCQLVFDSIEDPDFETQILKETALWRVQRQTRATRQQVQSFVFGWPSGATQGRLFLYAVTFTLVPASIN